MEGQLYPYAAGGTLPPAVEQAGYYSAPVTALSFDAAEELLHLGTEDGRVTVTHAPGLERYAGAHVHPHEYQVLTASPLENTHGGVVTVSAARACYTSGGCVKRWTVGAREGIDPNVNPLTCGAVDTHLLGGSGRAYVGRSGPEMLQIDIGTGKVSLTAELMPGTCTQGTSCIATGAARGLVACGGFGGELVMRDPRNKLRAETQLSSPAHAAGVTSVAAKGDLVVTCGLTSDRQGVVAVDHFVKVMDVRMGCRVLNVLQFPASAVCVSFDPKFNSTVVLGGQSGLVQTQDADRGGAGYQGAGFFSQAALGLSHGQRLTSMCASSSGEAFAFGDTAGYVHLWSVNDTPVVNAYTVHAEDPPRFADCVQRSFEVLQYEMAKMQLTQLGQPPPPAPASVFTADERGFVPEAQFHEAEDGGVSAPLSYVDPSTTVAVGRCPHIVPKAVLETARFVDFVGYAPNPHFRRGGVKGEAYRKAAPLRNKRAESKSAAAEAKRAAISKSKLFTQVGDRHGANATSPLPPLYHRVEVRLSANRVRFEEFDFSEHNRTKLVGLVNDLANCYVNPVLQTLHFTPELRAEVLMGHACDREFCLTCELGFLSYMLAQPPTKGAGTHSSSSSTAQPLNFLRTLRQVREAAALGLIEGRDELETRLDQSKPRRAQAFQRFILEQLHKEDSDSVGDKSGKAGDNPTGCVERLFALVSTQTHTCAQCSRVDQRESRSFQLDLQYPDKKVWRKGSVNNPSFSQCLSKSLCTSVEVRAWCEGHQAYTRMAQRKLPKRLPQVLSVNLGMRDPDDLRWWGADVDVHVLSAAASAPVEKHWLPQYIRVEVGDVGASKQAGEGVRVTQSADDVELLTGEGVTYELTSLTCLARRPAEEDDDDSPGGGLDETGAKKLAGHLLSFIKVTPPYVPVRGRFDGAPSPPKGESPGVSPLNQAAAMRAAENDGGERSDDAEASKPVEADDPPSTPASGLAAALAAGEAMYGENSGFQGITPSRVENKTHLDTDWLLFNDFCITPVEAKEVTRVYGVAKLPTLCQYTRMDRPTPKPLPPSPITADVYRNLTLDANLDLRRLPFRPFDYESEMETPGTGTLLGIDAEFVSLAPAVSELSAEGEEIVVQPVRLGLARVSVVRGDHDHPKRLTPIIDDYIRAVEPVYDYLTRFSGLVPGDLDPVTSKRHIVQLKHAYIKLRYLIDAGCVFIGHGLKQDFKMINVVVPPGQIIDTVELFHFKRQRKLSLRFLASYLLKADIQKDTHDSIEDARTAVRLYEKYLEMRKDGEEAFREKLLEIYKFGKAHGFTGEKRPDQTAAAAPPPPPGPPPAPPLPAGAPPFPVPPPRE